MLEDINERVIDDVMIYIDYPSARDSVATIAERCGITPKQVLDVAQFHGLVNPIIKELNEMAKKETMDAIETTLDHVEETVETLERIPKVNLNGTTKKQQILILSTVALVSVGVGAFGAFAVLKAKMKLHNEHKTAEVGPDRFSQRVVSE